MWDDPLAPFHAWTGPVWLLGPDGAALAANPAAEGLPPPREARRAPLGDGRALAFGDDAAAPARSLVFAMLGHEIRTPLNGILGMANLLARTPLSEAQRAYLAPIRQSGQNLLDLLNALLEFAQLEAGAMTLAAAPYCPRALVQSTAELLSPRARERGLDLEAAVDADVAGEVLGDDVRVRQILVNLVANAIKFTPSGGVFVRVARAGGGDDRLLFSVADTGVGVAPEKLAGVFEEFVQADASHGRAFDGVGLGLAIVRRLAQAMGGRAWLDSAPGAGATAFVELPAPLVAARRAPSPQLPAGARIALASASPVVVRAFAHAVGAAGGALIQAEAPADAAGCDLLVWDHEISRAPEALSWGPPVVALAAQEDRDAIESAKAAGFRGYLIKPLRPDAAMERMALLLRGAGAPGEDDRAEARPGAGLAVLIAEDNPINAVLTRALLEREGCLVTLVASGAQALAALEHAPFDLVFLDLHMPEMDGFQVAAAIRGRSDARAATPLIALTAAAGEGDRRACLAAGMDDFIAKPLDVEALHRLIARWTRRRERVTVAA